MRKLTILLLLAIAFCFTATAQNNGARGTVHGIVTGEKINQPVDSVQAFVYAADSGIIASGYTDAKGRYETNNVPAGTYNVKFVYPNKKAYTVTGVKIKGGGASVNIKQAIPSADGTVDYKDLGHKHRK